jgi:hypothetical protein
MSDGSDWVIPLHGIVKDGVLYCPAGTEANDDMTGCVPTDASLMEFLVVTELSCQAEEARVSMKEVA